MPVIQKWRTPLRGFHPDPVHRQNVLQGQVLTIQLCKKIVEFSMVQHIDQIVSVAVRMRDTSHRLSKLKGSSISQLCHSVERVGFVETPSTKYRPQNRDGRCVNGKRGDECQNHPHTETNSSESHRPHGDSDGARSAKRKEENRR